MRSGTGDHPFRFNVNPSISDRLMAKSDHKKNRDTLFEKIFVVGRHTK